MSACVFSFFIGDMELYDHLPLSHTSTAVPVSVSCVSPVNSADVNIIDLHWARCKYG